MAWNKTACRLGAPHVAVTRITIVPNQGRPGNHRIVRRECARCGQELSDS